MKLFSTCLFFLIANLCLAQLNDASTYNSYIDTADLRKHLFIIASDEMEGRETATQGQRKAAAYIENHFRSNGLVPVLDSGYQQKFPVYRDSLAKAVLIVKGIPLVHYSNFAVTNNSRHDTALSVNELVYAGSGLSDSTQDDYKGLDVKGKIVMVIPKHLAVKTRNKKRFVRTPPVSVLQTAAQKNGAAALLIVDSTFPRKPAPAHGPMYIMEDGYDTVPNTYIISDSVAKIIMGSDYLNLAQRKQKYNADIVLELDRYKENLESTNVIGMIQGTSKKDEAIIITAHYDHMGRRDSLIFFGADDDGSGTVTILELAEAFSKAAESGARPKRNIVFMAVSGEEKGLWGSEYYAQHPPFPLHKTSANLNIDMIGRVTTGRKEDSLSYIYVVGDNRISSDLRPISESANNNLYKFTLDYKFNDPEDPQRIYYRSDHYNFAKNGVPAIFYFSGLHQDYHRPTDTPDKINYPLLERRAHLIFHTAWIMANMDEMLKRDLF